MEVANKATRINLFDFKSVQMRTFHLTWFAFFLCFFGCGVEIAFQQVADNGHGDPHGFNGKGSGCRELFWPGLLFLL